MIKLFDSGAEFIIDRLTERGYQAYYVGGCVRDSIMGRTIADYDITTNCLADELLNVFSDCKFFTAGLKHGTVSLVINSNVYEVTTFRKDGEYLDSRRPEKVYFCDDIKQDLARRDFTCNAMAFNKNQGLIDVFNGFYDIQSKLIRAVGDAKMRFSEDALRILRALRFASKLGFEIEEKTKAALFEKSVLLKNISNERIISEFLNILQGLNCEHVLLSYRSVFEIFFPLIKGVSECEYFDIVAPIKFANSVSVKLAILCRDFNALEVKKLLVSLKCDSKTVREVITLCENQNFNLTNDCDLKFLMNRLNGYINCYFEFNRAILFAKENRDCLDKLNHFEARANQVIENGECYLIKHLALDGNHLIELGINQRQIGGYLNDLLLAVIKNQVTNNRKDLLNYLKEKLK